MRKFIPLGLLAVSAFCNVWLAFGLTGKSRPTPSVGADDSSVSAANAATRAATEGNAASAANGNAGAVRPAKLVPVVWPAPGTTNAELRTLAAQLRAAGFPQEAVTAVVTLYLREREQAKVAALPFWQLTNPGRTARALQEAVSVEVATQQEDVLGAAGSVVARLDPVERQRRYGNLSDDKIEALIKIDREHRVLAAALPARPSTRTIEEARERDAQDQALLNERMADFAAVLTPEELAAYELRNSPSANRVMNNLRSVTVSEEEYAALYQLQKNYDTATGNGFLTNYASGPEARAKAQAARYELNEQLRAVLPEERFYRYLETSDYTFGQTARFAEKQPAITPATTYELYKLNNEALVAMQDYSQQMQAARQLSAEEQSRNARQRRATEAALNARLESLLGPEAAAAYRQEPGMEMYFPKPPPPNPPKG